MVRDALIDYQVADYQVSNILESYYFNFIRKGDPNGDNSPNWPSVETDSKRPSIMNVDIKTGSMKVDKDYLYNFFNKIY